MKTFKLSKIIKYKALYFILIYITLSPVSYSKSFNNQLLVHENPGCPENSICNIESGSTRAKWIDILKNTNLTKKEKYLRLNQFKNKFGSPIGIYYTGENPLESNSILWDSPCLAHKKVNPKIYLGSKFLKKIDQSQNKSIFIPMLILFNKNSSNIYSYPLRESPLYKEGNNLFFNVEDEGIYYGLRVNLNGKYKILPPIVTQHSSQESACNESNLKEFKEKLQRAQFYGKLKCHKIWDRKLKKYFTYVRGEVCS